MNKKRVLICDDENSMLQIVKDVTDHMGFQAELYENGKLALEAILKSPPELIVTDIYMPEMSGIELLKQLNTKDFKIPVIFLTGSLDSRHLNEAISYGYFDFLHKPLDPFDLIETIQKALNFGFQEPPREKLRELLIKRH